MSEIQVERLCLGPLEACCYLVYDRAKNAAVIDPGDQPDLAAARLEALGLAPKGILLTHGHFDHVGGVNRLAERFALPVYAGLGEERLLEAPVSLFPGLPAADERPVRWERLLGEGDRLSLGTLEFEVLATPGHTPGGVCYRCGEALFTGDTLFAGGVGRTDLPGGDGAALKRSLEKLAALEGGLTVYPGHGPATDLDRERRSNPYLRGL